MVHSSQPAVVVIVGPTASGKTKLAVQLARRFKGEIISADSRQVYRGMDIGSGKDLTEYGVKLKIKPALPAGRNQKAKIFRIPYHLIDIASPKGQFTVAQYQRLAYKAIEDILARGKVPIICGGTGLYVSAVVEGYTLPEQPRANGEWRMVRKKLDQLSLRQLAARLKKIDPKTYQIIDKKNRRRVQRALEIFYLTGQPKSAVLKKQPPPYRFLLCGVTVSKSTLHSRIARRLERRLKQGMIAEVKKLHRDGVSWKKLESFGLEYRFVAQYLQKKISRTQMITELQKEIEQYAKRQLTWFRRYHDIAWIQSSAEASKLVTHFLNQ